MSAKLSPPEAQTAALIQQIRLGPIRDTFWLPLSYMMGIVCIESGFDHTRWNNAIPGEPWGSIPARDIATTGSIGLAQISTIDREDVANAYPNITTEPQIDPDTSLTTMMLTFDRLKTFLAISYPSPDAWTKMVIGYNVGAGNVKAGKLNWRYYYKWKSAQNGYAALDD